MLSEIVWRWIQEEKLADIQIYSIQPISFSGGAQSWGYSGCEHQLVVSRNQGPSTIFGGFEANFEKKHLQVLPGELSITVTSEFD